MGVEITVGIVEDDRASREGLCTLIGGTPAFGVWLRSARWRMRLNKDGDCSRRQAIRSANFDIPVDACLVGFGHDTIRFRAGILPAVSS